MKVIYECGVFELSDRAKIKIFHYSNGDSYKVIVIEEKLFFNDTYTLCRFKTEEEALKFVSDLTRQWVDGSKLFDVLEWLKEPC